MKRNIYIERIQNFLYSFYAKDIKDARFNEVYDALCNAIMQDIGKTWVKSKDISAGKQYYILSFEYQVGKFLENNIRSLGIEDKLKKSLEELGYQLEDFIKYEKEAHLGSGEIGIGSFYLLKELTNKKIKALAYALRYESGFARQEIKDGGQFERADFWLDRGKNREHRKGFENTITISDRKLNSIFYDMPIISEDASFVNSLRLIRSYPINKIDFSKFSKGSILEAYDDYIKDSSLTQFLYVDNSSYQGKLLRLKQEYFYCKSAVDDIFRRYLGKDTGKKAGSIDEIDDKIKIIVSDIHPTLAIIEFISSLHKDFEFSYAKAIKYSRKIFDHITFLATDDSREYYDMEMIKSVNKDLYQSIKDINLALIEENPKKEIIRNNYLIYELVSKNLCGRFIVPSKHQYEILKDDDNFKLMDFGFDRDLYVKNNNKNLVNLFKEYGIEDLSYEKIKKVSSLKENSSFIKSLDKIKFENKNRLINDLIKEEKNKINPYSIFDVQITNFHEAKRQLLNALSIASLYYTLKDNSNILFNPTTFIFSGKANEGYFIAKETIRFILALKNMIDKDFLLKDKIKIVFIENIDVTKARLILPAVDIYNNLTIENLDNIDFGLLQASFNMANIISTDAGILENKKIGNSIYKVEKNIENENMKAVDSYYSNHRLKYTVDNLINESYARFPYDFKLIFDYILKYDDSFNIFKDFSSILETKKKVNRDYLDLESWTQKEIDNLIWANEFILDDKFLNDK
jgi:starch phosphorylase